MLNYLTTDEQAEILALTELDLERIARVLLSEVHVHDLTEFTDDEVAEVLANPRVRKYALSRFRDVINSAFREIPIETFTEALDYDDALQMAVSEAIPHGVISETNEERDEREREELAMERAQGGGTIW